jgi:hypothetical protein
LPDGLLSQNRVRPYRHLRGANGSRECAPDDRLCDEAIHAFFLPLNGLLRFARNDDLGRYSRLSAVRLMANFLNQIKLMLPVQSHLQKHFPSPPTQITSISLAVPSHSEGRIAIVTDAGRDAVDAAALLTNGAGADGEVVWS